MMTARDPWVNMLRTTLACFAAGVGGADAVTVQPFDAALGLPDAFARRIARNTQSLLLEEANVARVIDPAGGSWYVERLTEDLAQTAWDWFTEIERAGGLAAALRLRTGRRPARRDLGPARGRTSPTAATRSPASASSRTSTSAGRAVPRHRPRPGGGLPRHRYAEEFEALRDRADAHAAATGAAPTVFLATLGPVAAHTARASFAANLFEAGGIATVPGADAGTDPAEIAGRVRRQRRDGGLPVLAPTRLYAERRRAGRGGAGGAPGRSRVWLAGPPGEYDGVDGYLYAGCDAVEVLEHDAA